jgi:hypothetical protein
MNLNRREVVTVVLIIVLVSALWLAFVTGREEPVGVETAIPTLVEIN